MNAIFKREFRSYFTNPIGYIVLAVFYFFLGLSFSAMYAAGDPNVSNVIIGMAIITIFLVPIITMRLMSEDKRQKVDQVLLTAPVKLSSIVLGKFFAALMLFAIGFAPTVIFELIVICYVGVNIMSYLYALLGILLLGSALISIGMFISSLTESSVVSAILAIVINILALYMSNFASAVKVGWISSILQKAAFINVFENFSETAFSVVDVVYFVSITAAFLFLCIRSLEKRRWA